MANREIDGLSDLLGQPVLRGVLRLLRLLRVPLPDCHLLLQCHLLLLRLLVGLHPLQHRLPVRPALRHGGRAQEEEPHPQGEGPDRYIEWHQPIICAGTAPLQ